MKYRFNNCLVISNSASTNIKRAMQLAGQLSNHFPPERIEIMEISNLNYKETEKRLINKAEGLSDQSLVCVAGGDGTLSTIVNILLNTKSIKEAARRAVIFPLWGGNSNDLAIMINGSIQRTSINNILGNAQVVSIHPLEVNLEHGKHTDLKLAICYASFGFTANVSELINHSEYRNVWFYHIAGIRTVFEIAYAFKALILAKPFSVEISNTKDSLYDLVLINGPRMAKRQWFPVQITDREFVEMTATHKLSGAILYLLNALHLRSTPQSKTERSLIVHEPIWMQLDGEVTKIPKETAVVVKLNDRPFYALSTTLRT